jgi:D-serine deaminase-like pyridoxal phosphate-dependent protein
MTEHDLRGAAALNRCHLGTEGGRARLETPSALLDLDIFEENLRALHEPARDAGMAVRPHAKSHKCATIVLRQIASGAVGICCAKPGELLALFEAGVPDLLLTSPLASLRKIDALAQAAARGGRIGVVVDRLDLVTAYSEAATRHGATLNILVDLDTGLKRSGVARSEEAVALARAANDAPGLAYRGVQAYQGRVQHIDGFVERRAANTQAGSILRDLLSALNESGLPPEVVSGGGTGSFHLDLQDGLFTEIQPGSYVFMDEGYATVDIVGTGSLTFGHALRIALTVIGHSSQGFAILDGGSKSFAWDGPTPQVFHAGRQVGRIEWCGDEFARLLPAPGETTLQVGDIVECTVPHCDPTINLHDVLHVVSGDRLIAFWPVEARGRAD